MDFAELFKDSLKYPLTNLRIYAILGALMFVSVIFGGIIDYNINLNSLFGVNVAISIILILGVLTFILDIFVNGYLISNLKSIIGLEDTMPEIDIHSNFRDGLKYLVFGIVYGVVILIAVLVLLLIAFVGGNYVHIILSAIFIFLAFIVVFFAGMMMTIGTVRLAKYGTLSDALNYTETWNDLKNIGILNFILWVILLLVISLIILLIIGIILALLGFVFAAAFATSMYLDTFTIIVGILITGVIMPYIALFNYRAMGLLYLSKDD